MSVIKAFVRCQLHENWWSCARSAEMTEGIVILFTVFHVAMFEVVERGQICHENLHRRFGKCLPEADSSAAIESCEREWMSLLPVRREEERALLVKSLRKELVWSLPLLCILGVTRALCILDARGQTCNARVCRIHRMCGVP